MKTGEADSACAEAGAWAGWAGGGWLVRHCARLRESLLLWLGSEAENCLLSLSSLSHPGPQA